MSERPWLDKLVAGLDGIPQPPASDNLVTFTEVTLGVRLPEPLKDFYRASNGIKDEWGWSILWPLERMAEENLDIWAYCTSNDTWPDRLKLLGFGDDGCGYPYCVARDGSSEEVVIFGWIDDEATHMADSVQSFWKSLSEGDLPHY